MRTKIENLGNERKEEMKNNLFKKVSAAALAAVMAVTFAPTASLSVFAAKGDVGVDSKNVMTNGSITIQNNGTYTVSGGATGITEITVSGSATEVTIDLSGIDEKNQVTELKTNQFTSDRVNITVKGRVEATRGGDITEWDKIKIDKTYLTTFGSIKFVGDLEVQETGNVLDSKKNGKLSKAFDSSTPVATVGDDDSTDGAGVNYYVGSKLIGQKVADKESIWAIQYSRTDGSPYGNLNWSYGLIGPSIDNVTDGACDFYKPSQNLVNAFRTGADGLPFLDGFNEKDYSFGDNADPRLFLTVGMPGLPYMFNKNFIQDETKQWSRGNGLYGYYISRKQNVDPALVGEYLIKGSYWASSMNRIVFRYADVLLERAEAYAQLGESEKAIDLVNQIRRRAASSTQMFSDYPSRYGVKIYATEYKGSYGKEDVIKIVKMERRLELGMECERFFDLVRWGDAATVLNKYYAEEADNCTIYRDAKFTAEKDEYLPIPASQIAASNGHYTQNIGNW